MSAYGPETLLVEVISDPYPLAPSEVTQKFVSRVF